MSHSGHCSGSCGSESHRHGHSHCGCSCHSCTCCSHHEHEEGCDSERLLAIADMAWVEVLKDKIKQNILTSDHRIDEIAKIVAETNRDFWRLEMAQASTEEHYDRRISEIMGDACRVPHEQPKKNKRAGGKKKK
jgi:hypothetical protein